MSAIVYRPTIVSVIVYRSIIVSVIVYRPVIVSAIVYRPIIVSAIVYRPIIVSAIWTNSECNNFWTHTYIVSEVCQYTPTSKARGRICIIII